MNNRILIVDDDLALRPFWELIVRRQSRAATIDWVVSSEEAKLKYTEHLARGHRFQLIVVDLFLAGSETGLDLIHFFELQSHFDSPIVLVSAVDDWVLLEKEVSASPLHIEVLQKPLSISACERSLDGLSLQTQVQLQKESL